MIKGHGGNVKALAQSIGCDPDEIMDMSSNLNPLGPPKGIEEFISQNISKIRSLPEPDAITIRREFSRFHGIDTKRVVAGNGTTWFIYSLIQALESKSVLIAGPSYADYESACKMYKVPYTYTISQKEDFFKPDLDRISSMAKQADIVFICNPNNPTGALLSKEDLKYLLHRHENTYFVIDESYLPFVDDASVLTFVAETDFTNLIVLSSMSKIFRIPGLRTGFLTTSPLIAEKIMAFFQPWSVNSLGQAVIEYIFNNHEKIEPFYKDTREYIQKEKTLFLNDMQGVDNIRLFDSATYFILAELTENLDAKTFCQMVGNEKILIRDCSNFFGLNDRFVRFSLKTRNVNKKLSMVVKKVLENA
ncbi:MAG: aminotransferase class I/II-fold pyridoxal phosphate-dependent enzyme [Desulfobacteraceae bacterium]|nr:aminotransferase class I/II-fold pyridoxal phosphate-dependent enzyme [Desulfobacteraceae bacterium]